MRQTHTRSSQDYPSPSASHSERVALEFRENTDRVSVSQGYNGAGSPIANRSDGREAIEKALRAIESSCKQIVATRRPDVVGLSKVAIAAAVGSWAGQTASATGEVTEAGPPSGRAEGSAIILPPPSGSPPTFFF